MTDDPKVVSILSHLAAHDAAAARAPAGPGRTVGIRDCGDCPLSAVRDGGGGALSCEADVYLRGVADRRDIPLGPDGWACPPPAWCPLRGNPVTLEVREP